jgi:hypothetical protein
MEEEEAKLLIIWSSGEREVAIETVLMYALNSKTHGWWEGVELCIWGPSAKLAVYDTEINVKLTHMMISGVKVTACKACADHLGLTGRLEEMGVEVKYMGIELTKALRYSVKVITF